MFRGAVQTTADRSPRIALALVGCAVVAVVPGGFVAFLFPKLAVLALAVLVAAGATAAGRLPGWAGAAVLVGTAGFVAAALAGGTPAASLLGRWPRYEGLPVLVLVAGCAWAGARLLGPDAPPDRWRWGSAVAGTAGLVLFAASLLDAAGVDLLGTTTSRSGSLLGNATDQGLVAAMLGVLLLGAGASSAGRARVFALVGCAAAVATVVLSGSRTSALALVVGVAVVVAARRRGVLLLAAGGVLAMLALGALLVPQLSDRLGSSHTLVGRRLLWEESWRIAREHLGAGIGPSRLVDLLPAQHTAEWVDRVGTAAPPDSPHDLFLQLLLAGGLPVLLVGVATVVLVAVAGVRSMPTRPEVAPLAAALAVGFVGLLVNPSSPPVVCLLALLAGALVAVPHDQGSSRTPERLVVAATAAALVVACVSATASEVVLRDALDVAATGDPAHAGDLLDTARLLRGGDSDVCLLGAQALAQRSDATDDGTVRDRAARASLRLAGCALRRTPDAVGALTAAGVAHLDLGDPQAALDAFARALALDPTDPQLPVLVARAQAAGRR